MRVAALPTVIVVALLQATPVRPVHVQAAPPEAFPSPPAEDRPSEEQEEADDEFLVRLTPEEARAASKRGALSGLVRQGSACPVLELQDGSARRFYFKDACDGLGSRILNVVGALIYAEKMNLHFAGIIPDSHCAKSHNTSIAPGMQAFFGFVDESEMYVDTLPNETRSFPSLVDLQKQLGKRAIGDGTDVCINSCYGLGDMIIRNQVSPTILAALRSRGTPLMQIPLAHFRPHAFNVAVHVRRDDVSNRSPTRFTSDEWYIWLMDIMRGKVPHAAFHVFSSLGSRGLHTSKDFDAYRNWGATVHLDTEARETMAHMARADVLVTAKSTFSYVSALLNPNCVLFQRWKKKMPEWVELPLKRHPTRGLREFTEEIASCMKRKLP